MPKFLDSPQWYENTGSQATSMPIIETTETNPDNLPKDRNAIYHNPTATFSVTYLSATTNYVQVSIANNDSPDGQFNVKQTVFLGSTAGAFQTLTRAYQDGTWSSWEPVMTYSAPSSDTSGKTVGYLLEPNGPGYNWKNLKKASQTEYGVAKIYLSGTTLYINTD